MFGFSETIFGLEFRDQITGRDVSDLSLPALDAELEAIPSTIPAQAYLCRHPQLELIKKRSVELLFCGEPIHFQRVFWATSL